MRTLLAALAALILTPPFAAIVSIAAALRIPERPGGVYWWIPRAWTRALLWAGGVTVRMHGAERMGTGLEPRIFASNHVSWYDVFTLAATLPRYAFVAKAELLRIPIFGAGARAVGTVPIERENRKSAFASYETAAAQVRGGRPIIVFPEGTRGRAYALRPFKKGPFVLAIAAQVPVVPVVLHGTMAIMPKGSWRIRPGVVDLHFLEPVPTAGLTYDDRDALSAAVHARMAALLEREYGIAPAPNPNPDESADAGRDTRPGAAPDRAPAPGVAVPGAPGAAPPASTVPDARV